MTADGVKRSRVTFPGGKRVDVSFGAHVVHTDQAPEHGGDGSAPEPFDLFLASLATCAGIYVLGFCQARNLPTAGLGLSQESTFEDGKLVRVRLQIELPPGFPEKYRSAVRAAALGCKVKKVLAEPPQISVDVQPAAEGPYAGSGPRADAMAAALAEGS